MHFCHSGTPLRASLLILSRLDVADMSKESQLVPLRLGVAQTCHDRTCQWGGSADEQAADVSGQVLSKLDKADEVDRRICDGC
jgi:hypothetical protein